MSSPFLYSDEDGLYPGKVGGDGLTIPGGRFTACQFPHDIIEW